MECDKLEILLPFVNELLSSDDEISQEVIADSPSTLDTEELVAIHPPADLPLPFGVEEEEDVVFIDPSSGEGKRILADRNTTVPEIFALLRQFVSPVGNRIGVIVKEMLKRKVGVNDIDITMGMSMLHYVVRSEAISSDQSELTDTIKSLMQNGASPHQKSVFTNMNAFHIAAYFNCWKSLEVMIHSMTPDEKNDLINSMSSEFDFGTALHIACANLSVNAAEILIKNGSDLAFLDELGRMPVHCIPIKTRTEMERKSAEKLRKMLNSKSGFFAIDSASDAKSFSNMDVDGTANNEEGHQSTVNNADGKKVAFKIGDHVFVGGTKRGVIRYIGATKFSPGVWCGIELDERLGKNDGSINGVRYFTCERSRGVFTPLSKMVHASSATVNSSDGKRSSKSSKSALPSKALSSKRQDANGNFKLEIGMSVLLNKLDKEGKIRFIGETDFAPGVWIGLSLTSPVGKNNGTVQGREYFRCKPKYGIMVRPSRISVNGISGDKLLP